MELSKLHDGFIVEDVLTIKVQVQVVRYLFSLHLTLTFNASINYFQVGSICLLCITMSASAFKYLREKTNRPFRSLDGQYRRELIRVYLSNVEQICRRFIDERRRKFSRFIEDKLGWSRLDKLMNGALLFYDQSHFQAIFLFLIFWCIAVSVDSGWQWIQVCVGT